MLFDATSPFGAATLTLITTASFLYQPQTFSPGFLRSALTFIFPNLMQKILKRGATISTLFTSKLKSFIQTFQSNKENKSVDHFLRLYSNFVAT